MANTHRHNWSPQANNGQRMVVTCQFYNVAEQLISATFSKTALNNKFKSVLWLIKYESNILQLAVPQATRDLVAKEAGEMIVKYIIELFVKACGHIIFILSPVTASQ